MVVHYADLHHVDLTRSFAYADSHSDLPMLSTVGNAVAVSPDVPLMRAATANQWSIVEWKIKPIFPRWATAPMRSAATLDPTWEARH